VIKLIPIPAECHSGNTADKLFMNLSHQEQSTLDHSYHFDNTCPGVSCKNEKDISGTPDIQIAGSVIYSKHHKIDVKR
jgi:hypothetical protein